MTDAQIENQLFEAAGEIERARQAAADGEHDASTRVLALVARARVRLDVVARSLVRVEGED